MIAALAMVVAGCQPPAANLDTIITATSDGAFDRGLHDVDRDFSLGVLEEIKDARQEFRFAVMTVSPGLSADKLREAVFRHITGHTVRSMLVLSYKLKIERLKDQTTRYENLIEIQEDHFTRPMTEAERVNLKSKIADVRAKIAAHLAERDQLQARQNELQMAMPEQSASDLPPKTR